MADIVVTAQRREERLQRVPISITALGSAQLETRGVRSVADLARTPINSVTVQPFAGNPQILILDLRGVTTSDPGQGTIEPGVAIYEDDVYVSRAQAAGNTLSDPERVEVLRGLSAAPFENRPSSFTSAEGDALLRSPSAKRAAAERRSFGATFDASSSNLASDHPCSGPSDVSPI